MTNFSNARTLGDTIGALLVLVLMVLMITFLSLIAYEVYDNYKKINTVKIVTQGNDVYTGLVSTNNGCVTVFSGKQKIILNSVDGKIKIEDK